MDHQQIDTQDIVGRYLRHDLDDETEALFEEHLLACDQCLNEVEADERLGLALSSVAERGELPEAPARLSWRLPLAWAASILLALVPVWTLHRQGNDLERRLLLDRQAASEAQGRDEARLQTLSQELQQARKALAAAEGPVELEPAPPKNPVDGKGLEDQLREATRPRSGVPVLHLAPTRSAGDEAVHRLTLSTAPEWVVLILEPIGMAERYDLELSAPDGSVILRAKSLEVDGYGALTLSLYSTDLKAGVHRLRLDPSGDEPAQTMSLLIVRPNGDSP